MALEPKVLFAKLKEVHYIVREQDKWALTAKGKLAGGRIKNSLKLGDYIEWPESFDVAQLPAHQSPDEPINLISATKLGNNFGISANKLNYLFSELGWLDKKLKGWMATEQGLKQGAVQSEDNRSGVPYVKWPETISQSKLLLNSITDITGASAQASSPPKYQTKVVSHSGEIETRYITTDGHLVRSKALMLIDNWLYMAEIGHAYERSLPIEEKACSDFYIPTGKVYIEYWEENNDPKFLAHKAKKLALYQKHNLRLIQLSQQDIPHLDEVFTRKLLKFAIHAY